MMVPDRQVKILIMVRVQCVFKLNCSESLDPESSALATLLSAYETKIIYVYHDIILL